MPGICSTGECLNKVFARGVCRNHYRKLPRVNGSAKGQTCAAEGCERSAVARGCCALHHRRLIKTGSVDGPTVQCQRCGESWTHTSRGGRPHALCGSCRETHGQCSMCRVVKERSEFYIERTTGRPGSRCRDCSAIHARVRNVHPPTQEQQERHRLRNRYGITPERRAEMEAEQDGRCAICMEQTRLVIDHCHVSKAVRRLLCGKCNSGLGMFRDNTQFLAAAIDYLKTNGGA